MNVFVYDNTFDGFLSAVFESYELKAINPIIVPANRYASTFFDTATVVNTDSEKTARVWKGIRLYATAKGARNVYKTFLSENKDSEALLLHFIQRTFKEKTCVQTDFSDPKILKMAQIVKKVDREKHRMDAFVRFKETKDGVYFATIAPDFNVIPLLYNHFKSRYADQKWIIYDIKRNYGIYYNLAVITQITFEDNQKPANNLNRMQPYTQQESAFELLWQTYFKSTNIASRKNDKLHVQHVPKRYWKYLSEKS